MGETLLAGDQTHTHTTAAGLALVTLSTSVWLAINSMTTHVDDDVKYTTAGGGSSLGDRSKMNWGRSCKQQKRTGHKPPRSNSAPKATSTRKAIENCSGRSYCGEGPSSFGPGCQSLHCYSWCNIIQQGECREEEAEKWRETQGKAVHCTQGFRWDQDVWGYLPYQAWSKHTAISALP